MSLPNEPASGDTSHRDALYRTLYLRREYGQLAARSRQLLEENTDPNAVDPEAAFSPSTSDALELDTLRDIVLLPPTEAAPRPGTAATSPQQQQQRCWRGLVYVRHRPSPWYGAVFSFLVFFPERYPFECPVLLLEQPLRSHPLLSRGSGSPRETRAPGLAALGAVVPFFDDVYCSVDPMRVSVMALVMKHLKLFFYPTAWPDWWTNGGAASRRSNSGATATSGSSGNDISGGQGTSAGPSSKLSAPPPFPTGGSVPPVTAPTHPRISRMLARRDVKRYGLLHRGDVVLGHPYVDLLATDVTQQLLGLFRKHVEAAEERRRTAHVSSAGSGAEGPKGERPARRLADTDEADAAVMRWSEWYGRVLLPQILALP